MRSCLQILHTMHGPIFLSASSISSVSIVSSTSRAAARHTCIALKVICFFRGLQQMPRIFIAFASP